MEESEPHPAPESHEVEVVALGTGFIKSRRFDTALHVDIPFKNKGEDAGPRGPKGIIEHGQPVCKVYLTTVAIVESEPQLAEDQDHVFVEIVTDKQWDASIAPAAVSEQQRVKELKLPDGVVSRPNCLRAFFASYSHSYVRLHYHRHVIGSISDA